MCDGVNMANSENKRIFESARDHLNDASLKNTEALDKAILVLSSGGLVTSLTFIKSVVPISEAVCLGSLKLGWVLFSIALVSTVVSFLLSGSAITEERRQILDYYIKGADEAGLSPNYWGRITYWVNRASVLAFVMGVIVTVIFVWLNT